MRLRGYYLAVATLGLGLLIWMFFNNQSELTGGPNGVQVPRLVLFGWRAAGPLSWYWISGVTLVLSCWIALNLINSPTGRAFRAIHDSEIASRVLGIDIARYKSLVFVLSAVYAAIAGAYLALFDGFVTPDSSGYIRSIEFVVMAVLGGLGSILGSIVGSAFLVVLPQALTVFHEYEEAVLGLIMIVFMIFLPGGIVPSAIARWRWRMYVSGLLRIENVGISFGGVQALFGVTLDIRRGEIFAVIGPNGAGKTTLFNVISGLYRRNKAAWSSTAATSPACRRIGLHG